MIIILSKFICFFQPDVATVSLKEVYIDFSALKNMNEHRVASDVAAHYSAGHQSPTQGNAWYMR